jgi:hypothetical protein
MQTVLPLGNTGFPITKWCFSVDSFDTFVNPIPTRQAGNALARVQRVHAPADLWDIPFCTR